MKSAVVYILHRLGVNLRDAAIEMQSLISVGMTGAWSGSGQETVPWQQSWSDETEPTKVLAGLYNKAKFQVWQREAWFESPKWRVMDSR